MNKFFLSTFKLHFFFYIISLFTNFLNSMEIIKLAEKLEEKKQKVKEKKNRKRKIANDSKLIPIFVDLSCYRKLQSTSRKLNQYSRWILLRYKKKSFGTKSTMKNIAKLSNREFLFLLFLFIFLFLFVFFFFVYQHRNDECNDIYS